jgi:hypothetical protein
MIIFTLQFVIKGIRPFLLFFFLQTNTWRKGDNFCNCWYIFDIWEHICLIVYCYYMSNFYYYHLNKDIFNQTFLDCIWTTGYQPINHPSSKLTQKPPTIPVIVSTRHKTRYTHFIFRIKLIKFSHPNKTVACRYSLYISSFKKIQILAVFFIRNGCHFWRAMRSLIYIFLFLIGFLCSTVSNN